MQKNRAFAYTSADDDISDANTSSAISNQSEISKCNAIKVRQLLSPMKFNLSSLISNIEQNVKIAMESNPLDSEYFNKSVTNIKLKEKDDELRKENRCDGMMKIEEENEDEDEDEDSDTNISQSNNSVNTLGKLHCLGRSATAEDISMWMRQNGFENCVSTFNGFNYFDLRRLTRSDFIEMCGTIKGIQMYNALQMRPVLPLRTIYCAIEKPNDNAMEWQAVYLHCLNAHELDTQIIARFNLPRCKHSVWMEGPYGIHVMVDNEKVLYMEDNDLFLIQRVQYPNVDHYKVVMKRYM